MAVTQSTDMFSAQVLADAVRGRFKQKNAFMGSTLVSSGAVIVRGNMPQGGRGALNKTIDVPYWGTLGAFANNPEGSSATPQKIAQTSEQAAIGRSSLMVETSVLAQGVGVGTPELGDPYQEAADQAMVQAEREMDRLITNSVKATPLIKNYYSATTPDYLTPQKVIESQALWGDELTDGTVAMVTHSQALTDLATLTDSNGNALLQQTWQPGASSMVSRTLGGVPLLVSDRVPLDGSTMGTVTSAGTSPPVATLAGTPEGPWDLRLKCTTGGAHATATFQFSADGGNTWSADITTTSADDPIALTDTAVDSLVGNNGTTGLTVAFAAGTFNVDNTWSSTANLNVSTLMLQAGAAAFWYSADHLRPKTDIDIAEDTDLFAMHLYYISHMYRRRRRGTRPGVIRLRHNVRSYIG